MTILRGVLPIELEVGYIDNVPYISRRSLYASVSSMVLEKRAIVDDAALKRTAFIPTVRVAGIQKYTEPMNRGNRNALKCYSIKDSITFIEYALSKLGTLQKYVMRLIREEYGEFI